MNEPAVNWTEACQTGSSDRTTPYTEIVTASREEAEAVVQTLALA